MNADLTIVLTTAITALLAPLALHMSRYWWPEKKDETRDPDADVLEHLNGLVDRLDERVRVAETERDRAVEETARYRRVYGELT